MLKENQGNNVFYQTISNSIKSNKLNHAFLLTGDIYQIKEMALYLAKSILCDSNSSVSNSLACNTCDTCSRIEDNIYPDLILIDGSDNIIKKNDIIKIQETFKKTSLENKSKIYIIHCVDNCRPQTINSLLKMLEEPTDDIYAIFTTKNIEKVLPTIISRCQILKIRNNTYEYLKNELKDIIPEDDLNILCQLYSNPNTIKELYEEGNYCDLKHLLNNYLNNDKKDLILQKDLLNDYSNDIELFINLMIIHYKKQLETTLENSDSLLKILYNLIDCKDKLSSGLNANVSLLIDQLIYNLDL